MQIQNFPLWKERNETLLQAPFYLQAESLSVKIRPTSNPYPHMDKFQVVRLSKKKTAIKITHAMISKNKVQ